MHRLGITAMLRGQLAQARELVELSDEIHGRTGDVWGRAQTVGTLGAISRDEGDERSALELVRESVVLAREAGVPWWESGALAEVACLALNAGLLDDGEARARESLAIADRLRDRPGRIFGVGLLARVAAERGLHERAGLGERSKTRMPSRHSVAGGATARHVKAEFSSWPDPTSNAVARKAAR